MKLSGHNQVTKISPQQESGSLEGHGFHIDKLDGWLSMPGQFECLRRVQPFKSTGQKKEENDHGTNTKLCTSFMSI